MNNTTEILRKKGKSSLRDIILGGQDGLVNVLGLSLGLFAAHSDSRIILIAGLAAGFAESISMGAVAYTSSLADKDFYEKAKSELEGEIKTAKYVNKEDIYSIYKAKGFEGKVLEEMVDQVCNNKELWTNTLMTEYLNIQAIDTHGLILSSVVVGISALVGSAFPLISFLFTSTNIAMIIALILSALILFAIGAYKAITLVGSWWKAGMQMVLIGMLSAFAGFFIGLLLKVN